MTTETAEPAIGGLCGTLMCVCVRVAPRQRGGDSMRLRLLLLATTALVLLAAIAPLVALAEGGPTGH